MKKVLITGATGFVGANVARACLGFGYDTSVLTRKESDFWRLEDIKKKLNIYYPDLLDYTSVEKVVAEIKPDIVLHFAAYGANQKNQQDIDITINVNFRGTVNLADACHKIGVKCFINTGSSSEYGIKSSAMEETDMLEPDNMYAIAKSAATLYCQMLARKFGFPAVTIRPFAVYGYFEEKERLIPSVIRAYLAGKPPELSKPDSARDFIFIEDLISGYLAAVERIESVKGEVFNLGSGKQHAIGDVVDIVKKITGSAADPSYGKIAPAQTEPAVWVSDISKAEKLLGWKPEYSLEEGLAKDVKWFKNNMSLYE